MRLIDLEGDTNFTLKNQSAMKGQKLHPKVQPLTLYTPFFTRSYSFRIPSIDKSGDRFTYLD